jgi:hypothetical protein
MPNWCYTNINICHNDKEKLNAFFDKVEEWSDKQYKTNDFDNGTLGWLGNIVGNSGLAEWKVKENGREDFVPSISCRGSLQTFELHDNSINIDTETAWGPMLEMWRLLCDKYLQGADIYYTAEESGNGLYQTNDPDVAGTYYIDIWEPPEEFEDEESIYEAEEDDVIDFLQRVLKTEEKNIDALLIMAESIDDPWFSIHKWELVDIDEVISYE